MLKCFVVVLLVLLSGCASNPKWLENRIACTPDGTELHAISKWGPLEFGSEIAAEDAAAVCSQPRQIKNIY